MVKSAHRISLGRLGEVLAGTFLEERGYTILGRNIRTPYGEIDLIAQQGGTIIFLEVKTRSSKTLGPPEISITPVKQAHMRSAAEYYIQQHPELNNDWRLDVIAIQLQADQTSPQIVHFENVIT
jgi:putative endonuclease